MHNIDLSYETDLTDEQWEFIEPRFKELFGNYGNRAEWPKRELANAVSYPVKTGYQWKLLPKDGPLKEPFLGSNIADDFQKTTK
jgi:transposase